MRGTSGLKACGSFPAQARAPVRREAPAAPSNSKAVSYRESDRRFAGKKGELLRRLWGERSY